MRLPHLGYLCLIGGVVLLYKCFYLSFHLQDLGLKEALFGLSFVLNPVSFLFQSFQILQHLLFLASVIVNEFLLNGNLLL